MPRGNLYLEPGHIYHLTHRCHNRVFLFRFALDRQRYRTMLRERLSSYGIALLNYCITSNHTHLLVRVRDRTKETLARFMQSLEGDFARAYNQRKKRQGAFWSDRYHAVMIQDGRHLRRCLAYIDLNMVRAGVVDHPSEWEWTGYTELMGKRRRNRLIDTRALLDAVALNTVDGLDSFRRQHGERIEQALASRALRRQPYWTESIAVGDRDWVGSVGTLIRNRMKVEIEEGPGEDGLWRVREAGSTYSTAMD